MQANDDYPGEGQESDDQDDDQLHIADGVSRRDLLAATGAVLGVGAVADPTAAVGETGRDGPHETPDPLNDAGAGERTFATVESADRCHICLVEPSAYGSVGFDDGEVAARIGVIDADSDPTTRDVLVEIAATDPESDGRETVRGFAYLDGETTRAVADRLRTVAATDRHRDETAHSPKSGRFVGEAPGVTAKAGVTTLNVWQDEPHTPACLSVTGDDSDGRESLISCHVDVEQARTLATALDRAAGFAEGGAF